MKSFEDIAKEGAVQAQARVDAERTRRQAVSTIFDMLGRACRTESERDGVVKKLESFAADGIITAEELASYAGTITVRDPRTRVAPAKMPEAEGRAKDVIESVRGKSRGGAYDLTKAEFDEVWRKI